MKKQNSLEKQNAVKDFMDYKKVGRGMEFEVLVWAKNPKEGVFEENCPVQITYSYCFDSYELSFMEDFIRPYVGHLQMSFKFLENVNFDGANLSFVTSDGYEIYLA